MARSTTILYRWGPINHYFYFINYVSDGYSLTMISHDIKIFVVTCTKYYVYYYIGIDHTNGILLL